MINRIKLILNKLFKREKEKNSDNIIQEIENNWQRKEGKIEKILNKVNGSRIYKYEENKLYLCVIKPENGGEPISLKNIQDELDGFGIQYNKDTLKDIVKKQSGEFELLVENISDLDLDKIIIKISIEKDGLLAKAMILPRLSGSTQIKIEDILLYLVKKGVCFNVDMDEVKKIIDLRLYNEYYPVAKMLPPRNGNNAEIIFHFNKNKDRKPLIKDNDIADYRELDLFTSVNSGELLLEKIEATLGIDGCTVTGKILPCKNGKDKKIILGKGVEIMENKVYATENGYVSYTMDKISVLPLYEVKGNVDFSTGNIDFVGHVSIIGDVINGFTVKAEGDIYVGGNVEGGSLNAGGNITIKGGVRGNEKQSVIICNGTLDCKFAENAILKAGVEIIIKNALLHCTTIAGLGVKITNNDKGMISGGLVRTSHYIEASVIGSKWGTKTDLEIGVKPELRERYHEIVNEIYQIEQLINETEKFINLINMYQNNKKELSKEILLKKNKAVKALKELKQKEINLNQEKDSLKEEMVVEITDCIVVRKNIYPGVTITIGDYKKIIDDFEGGGRYYFNMEEQRIIKT